MSSTNSNGGNNGKKLKGNLKKHKKPNILDPPESSRGNAETSVSHSTVPVPPNNLPAPRFAMPSNPNYAQRTSNVLNGQQTSYQRMINTSGPAAHPNLSIPNATSNNRVSNMAAPGEVTRGVIPLICLLIFCTVQWVETS